MLLVDDVVGLIANKLKKRRREEFESRLKLRQKRIKKGDILKFLKKGNEASTVSKYKTMKGKDVVLKSYKVGVERRGNFGKIDKEDFLLRFNLMKKAFKKGVPVVEPVSFKVFDNTRVIDGKKIIESKIIWKEKEGKGVSFLKRFNKLDEKRYVGGFSQSERLELMDMKEAFSKAEEQVWSFISEEEGRSKVVIFGDINYSHAFWDPVKKKVTFTDVFILRKKK